MTPADKDQVEKIRARVEQEPSPPLFDWDEESLRVAYLNGGLAKATYDLQCRYVGPCHAEVCTRLIEDSIRTAVRTDIPYLLDFVERLENTLNLHAGDVCSINTQLERALQENETLENELHSIVSLRAKPWVEENAALREALEYYAAHKFECSETCLSCRSITIKQLGDNGNRARAVLAKFPKRERGE